MGDLQVFQFQEERHIRVFEEDGELWLVAKDVAEALGHEAFHPNLVEKVPDMWRGIKRVYVKSAGCDRSLPTATSSKARNTQEMICLTEQGFYFFVIRSDKPAALPLQIYVAGTVLPAIRKTGKYLVPKKTYTKAEIEEAGKAYFLECYQEGGLELYMERRHPPRKPWEWEKPEPKLTRQEKMWLEEAETMEFLVKEGRI